MIKRVIWSLLISFMLLSFLNAENYSRSSSTPDGYEIDFIGTIEEDGTIKYVILDSEDTEELFLWEFEKFNEAMEHFHWLKELPLTVDFRRDNWRQYSYKATVSDDNKICYYISKKQRIGAEGKNAEWRR